MTISDYSVVHQQQVIKDVKQALTGGKKNPTNPKAFTLAAAPHPSWSFGRSAPRASGAQWEHKAPGELRFRPRQEAFKAGEGSEQSPAAGYTPVTPAHRGFPAREAAAAWPGRPEPALAPNGPRGLQPCRRSAAAAGRGRLPAVPHLPPGRGAEEAGESSRGAAPARPLARRPRPRYGEPGEPARTAPPRGAQGGRPVSAAPRLRGAGLPPPRLRPAGAPTSSRNLVTS